MRDSVIAEDGVLHIFLSVSLSLGVYCIGGNMTSEEYHQRKCNVFVVSVLCQISANRPDLAILEH